jgi:hyperosmotically inducible protein
VNERSVLPFQRRVSAALAIDDALRRIQERQMMKSVILLLVGVVAAACEQPERGDAAAGADGTRTTANVPADNTDKNERDRSGAALTPTDQGGSEADRTVTQQVRQGVMGEDALSTTGKNVKIITVDGVVTLRGPVKTAQEKATIASIAQRVTGVKRVDNQLETVTN